MTLECTRLGKHSWHAAVFSRTILLLTACARASLPCCQNLLPPFLTFAISMAGSRVLVRNSCTLCGKDRNGDGSAQLHKESITYHRRHRWHRLHADMIMHNGSDRSEIHHHSSSRSLVANESLASSQAYPCRQRKRPSQARTLDSPWCRNCSLPSPPLARMRRCHTWQERSGVHPKSWCL